MSRELATEIAMFLLNSQRQHRALHIQKDVHRPGMVPELAVSPYVWFEPRPEHGSDSLVLTVLLCSKSLGSAWLLKCAAVPRRARI